MMNKLKMEIIGWNSREIPIQVSFAESWSAGALNPMVEKLLNTALGIGTPWRWKKRFSDLSNETFETEKKAFEGVTQLKYC